jgi:thiol-disulfide isomerase/thioredoxin
MPPTMQPSRLLPVFAVFVVLSAANAAAQSPALTAWNALQAKRLAVGAYHQEFDVNITYARLRDRQGRRQQHVVDANGAQWRETIGRGSSARVSLFDGQTQFQLDGDEFIRIQRKSKDASAAPGPYEFGNFEMSKLVEVERRPCGYSTNDRVCVVFDVPVKQSMAQSLSAGVVTIKPGVARLMFDTETGVVVTRTTSQPVEFSRDSYRLDVVFGLKSVSYPREPQAGVFAVPTNLREVKKFTPWTAKRMNNTLSGKPAPELNLTTLDGKPVSLDSLKGKTVLLDFWATWCPPCRVDGPALDKLYKRYGSQLAIVGLSVGEDRGTVEAFLKQHPHSFPMALTSENELSRHYDVESLPTYIIVDADGNFEMAVAGDKGFDGLRSRLKKAGLDVD